MTLKLWSGNKLDIQEKYTGETKESLRNFRYPTKKDTTENANVIFMNTKENVIEWL